MKNEGFEKSENNFCLYVKVNASTKIYLLLYVDDLLILGTQQDKVDT